MRCDGVSSSPDVVGLVPVSAIMAQVKQQSITVPMLLSEQLASNPFLACKDFHEFCKLRLAKDVF